MEKNEKKEKKVKEKKKKKKKKKNSKKPAKKKMPHPHSLYEPSPPSSSPTHPAFFLIFFHTTGKRPEKVKKRRRLMARRRAKRKRRRRPAQIQPQILWKENRTEEGGNRQATATPLPGRKHILGASGRCSPSILSLIAQSTAAPGWPILPLGWCAVGASAPANPRVTGRPRIRTARTVQRGP